MKGKQIDTDFVMKFSSDCISKNKSTTDEICEEAVKQISEIDEQIKKRNKLMDVLSFFKYKKQNKNNLSVNMLGGLNKELAREICNLLNDNNYIDLNSLKEKEDVNFMVKKLYDLNIVSKNKNKMIEKSSNWKLLEEFIKL